MDVTCLIITAQQIQIIVQLNSRLIVRFAIMNPPGHRQVSRIHPFRYWELMPLLLIATIAIIIIIRALLIHVRVATCLTITIQQIRITVLHTSLQIVPAAMMNQVGHLQALHIPSSQYLVHMPQFQTATIAIIIITRILQIHVTAVI